LEWGNLQVTEALLLRCARREGWLGNLLAEGPKDLAQALGGPARQWVVHTKGGTPAQHDWRPMMKCMLNELVGTGGMKAQGGGTGASEKEPPADLRYREKWGPLDPESPDGWALSQLLVEQIKQGCGAMGGCWFALSYTVPDSLRSMVDSLNATTGWDVSLDELLDLGLRAIILQNIFGTQRGWIPEHDWQDVGARFIEPIPDGKYKGFTIGKWLPELVYEYHRLCGRHEKSGRPFFDTLERLGLTEFQEWAHVD
jgi:aldehyde:ferredoxin oxidoreductase